MEYDWIWQPSSATFEPFYHVHEPVFGKQSHGFGSPHWQFTLTLPPKAEKDRREIMSLFARTRGTAVVNMYDPRILAPAYYHRFRHDPLLTSMVPDLSVKATDKANSTITVNGTAGDYITVGDPIAFTHEGIRYYFQSHENMRITGADQVLEVYIRPRKTLTGIDIVTDRIKPTCRFNISINDKGGGTDANGLTTFKVKGTEFVGVIL